MFFLHPKFFKFLEMKETSNFSVKPPKIWLSYLKLKNFFFEISDKFQKDFKKYRLFAEEFSPNQPFYLFF